MSIVTRTRLIFRAKTSAALDQLEDPIDILTYAEAQQRELLTRVGQGLIEVSAARHRLEHRALVLRNRVPQLEEQAHRAIEADREDLARVLLGRKHAVLAELDDLKTQIADVTAEERSMLTAHQQLTLRVEEFRHHRLSTSARVESATARVAVGEMLTGVSSELAEMSMAMGRAEEKATRLQARAVAIDSLVAAGAFLGSTGFGDPLECELRDFETRAAIDEELAALRSHRQAHQGDDPVPGSQERTPTS